MKRILQIIFFLYLTVMYLFSQDLRFRHLSVADGLSQNTINCIYQDHLGYVWCGTEDGLNRYDGYQFKVYKHNPLDSTSLSHSWIWDIKEDKNKNLWVATWQGLNRYDRTNGKFVRYLCSGQENNAINGQRPTALCTDSSGVLWVGTWGNGLKYYIPAQDRFKSFNDDRFPSDHIRTLYVDSKGTLWVGTWNGLVSLTFKKGKDHSLKVYQHQPDNQNSLSSDRITSLVKDRSGYFWIGTLGGGVNCFSPADSSFKHYVHIEKDAYSLSNNDVSFVYEDRDNQLWLGTISGGLDRLNRESGTFTHFRYQPDNPSSISGNKIYSIMQDRSGMLWIGSDGLNLLSRKLNRFKHFRHNPHDPQTLSHNKVWSFCEDWQQKLWIGTDGGGFDQYNPQKAGFISYRNDPKNINSLSSNNVSAILCDQSHNLWIGTRGGGLNRFNILSKKFTRFQDDRSIPEKKGINYIMSLCFDKHHKLWIGTFDQGIIVYDMRRKTFKKYERDPANSKSLSGNYISTLFRDSKGVIWVGGWGGGVCRFDEKEGTFTRFIHTEGNPNSLISNIVHSIYETKERGRRILWVGTNSGLSYMVLGDSLAGIFRHMPSYSPLSGEVIYAILNDADGNLWLSSGHGLYRLNTHTMKVKRFSPSDGLQSNEFNAGACLKRSNGQLLFGGVNGFNMFSPQEIKESTFKAPLRITSFKIFDRPLQVDQIQLKRNGIRLEYWQNFFSLEFSSFDFNAPEENRYKYKMEGLDRKWIDAGSRHYASYTNLDPGKYTLKIKGSNSDGIWSNQQLLLNILIAPPFWKTWWFQLLAILILLGLLYLFYRIRLERALEIERLRVQIASDLHDDIGSALTKIAIHSEIIQNTNDKPHIYKIARTIGEVSREVIVAMSDTIWSIDARNDTIGDLLDRMKDLGVDLLTPKDIQFHFLQRGLNPDHKMAINIRQNLFLIYKEAINNIARHADARDVWVNLLNKDGRFEMKIADNGQGFDIQKAESGNGLKNMKMRAERIDARIEFLNQNGLEILLKMKAV